MTDTNLNIKWSYMNNPNVKFRTIIRNHSEYISLIILKSFYEKIKSYAVVDNYKNYE